MSNILTHSQKLDKFRNELEAKIIRKVKRQVRYSKHLTCKAILIKDANVNLDGDRWLEEVTRTELVDNKGYSYQYGVLSIKDLCEVADEIFWPGLNK